MGQTDTGLVPKGRHFGLQFLAMGGACSVGRQTETNSDRKENRETASGKNTSVDKEMKREFRNNDRIPIRKTRKDTSVPKEKVSRDRINKNEERIMTAKEG